MNLREKNVAEHRKNILDNARELISVEGVAALSMRTLARKAGFAVSTLYNLFGSRDEIVMALIRDGLDSLSPEIQEKVVADPAVALLNISTVPVERLIENKSIFFPIIAAGYYNVQTRAYQYNIELYTWLIRIIEELIESAVQQGVLTRELHPRLLAAEIFYTYRIAVEDWACGEIEDEELLRRVRHGVLALLVHSAAGDLQEEIKTRLGKVKSGALEDLERRFPGLR